MKKSAIVTMVVIVAGVIMLPVVASANHCCGGHTPVKAKATSKIAKAIKTEAKVVAQSKCPIMGGKINKAIYTEHNGKRIYVCCKGCIAKIDKEPAKYIKKLEDAGVTLERVQAKCPVMGGKIDKSLFVEHDGKKIYACCKGCIPKIKADPEKYAKKVADELKKESKDAEKEKDKS